MQICALGPAWREAFRLNMFHVGATNTCSNRLTNIEGPERLDQGTWLLHGSCLRYLHPSCSAGLIKSDQARCDSSYVDSVPNVVWRLGEHEMGPSRASLRDVIPSPDERLTRFRACLHVHETETHFDMTCAADIFSQVCRAGAIGSGPLLPPCPPRDLFCLVYCPPSPTILCTTAATVIDRRPKRPPLAPLEMSRINTPLWAWHWCVLTRTYFSTHTDVSYRSAGRCAGSCKSCCFFCRLSCWRLHTQQNTLTEAQISFFVFMSGSWWAALYEWVMRGGRFASAA